MRPMKSHHIRKLLLGLIMQGGFALGSIPEIMSSLNVSPRLTYLLVSDATCSCRSCSCTLSVVRAPRPFHWSDTWNSCGSMLCALNGSATSEMADTGDLTPSGSEVASLFASGIGIASAMLFRKRAFSSLSDRCSSPSCLSKSWNRSGPSALGQGSLLWPLPPAWPLLLPIPVGWPVMFSMLASALLVTSDEGLCTWWLASQALGALRGRERGQRGYPGVPPGTAAQLRA
mmetsp:Transcript_21922/g.55813  ORF Transcript_21922/g.55813 Transcript_21922/m.55813 type:complete len:230 (+) Transcript_21922:422-1111(+)